MIDSDCIEVFLREWKEDIGIIFRKEHFPVVDILFDLLWEVLVSHRAKPYVFGLSCGEIPVYKIMEIIEYWGYTYELIDSHIETSYEVHREESSHRVSYDNRIFSHLLPIYI